MAKFGKNLLTKDIFKYFKIDNGTSQQSKNC